MCVCVCPPVNQASISGYLAGWFGVRCCRRGWEMTVPCFLLNTCIRIFHLSVYCLNARARVCLSIAVATHSQTHLCMLIHEESEDEVILVKFCACVRWCVHAWTRYVPASDVEFLRDFNVVYNSDLILWTQSISSVCECVCVCVPCATPPQREVVMNHVSANLLFKGALRTEW